VEPRVRWKGLGRERGGATQLSQQKTKGKKTQKTFFLNQEGKAHARKKKIKQGTYHSWTSSHQHRKKKKKQSLPLNRLWWKGVLIQPGTGGVWKHQRCAGKIYKSGKKREESGIGVGPYEDPRTARQESTHWVHILKRELKRENGTKENRKKSAKGDAEKGFKMKTEKQ